MVTFHFLKPVSPSGLLSLGDAAHVAEVLRGGGLAVLPTETGYMLAASALSPEALHLAFHVKQRDLGQPMHVACASIAMAARFAQLNESARALMAAFTPGPLTVVAAQTDALPDKLVTLNGTVGIRVPDHPATLQIVAEAAVPVTATSMNRSGEESRPVDEPLLRTFDWAGLTDVPVVLDHASIRETAASTLVRVTGPEPEILRAGPVGPEQIDAVLSKR